MWIRFSICQGKSKAISKYMKSPLEHFSRERISYLKKISYPEKENPGKNTQTKIGRNDPCPCGLWEKIQEVLHGKMNRRND